MASLVGDAVGFASFSRTPESAIYKLHKLYVKTGIQNKGLGRVLIEAVLLVVEKENADALLLNVNRHIKARFYYESLVSLS
ncbi:MAG: GNAT family N-acetyltransferase [Bacteroidota bacterium]